MPDISGWPTALECVKKLAFITDPDANALLAAECVPLLASTIADFQGPVGPMGTGGTGRLFTPTVSQRLYSGNGFARMTVDDIVPNTPVSILVYGTPITDSILQEADFGAGYNILVRPASAFPLLSAIDVLAGIWPVGNQNISVQAVFGYAAQVPADVYEAVRCKVVYDALVTGIVGIDGVGTKLREEDNELDTNSAPATWRVSSPIGVFLDQYNACKLKYRRRQNRRNQALIGRIS